jgi:hypothetical protein
MDSPREVRQPESITYGLLLGEPPTAASTPAPARAGLAPAFGGRRLRPRRLLPLLLLLLLLLLVLREWMLRWTPRTRCVKVKG